MNSFNSRVQKELSVKQTTSYGSNLPVRWMSPAKLHEHCAKGLCYKCNEKFVPRHRCKKLFLSILWRRRWHYGAKWRNNSARYKRDAQDIIACYFRSKSTRNNAKGGIGNMSATVLIDSGSTHNFLSEVLAKNLGLQPEGGEKFEVVLASGENLSSPGKCTGVKWSLQGVPIFVNFYMLPFEGYDILQGTQWLHTLGPIWWDFAKLQMKFRLADWEVVLQGQSVLADKLIGELNF